MNELSSLEQLSAMCATPIEAQIAVRGQKELVTVRCRPLNPAQVLALDLVLREVVPPNKKSRPDGPDVFDFNDPKYVEARAKAEHTVRCLTVYWCCPLFDQQRTDKETRDEAVDKVVSAIPDFNVLASLAEQINAGIGIAERVAFT